MRLNLKEKLEGKSLAKTTRIGSDKVCPLASSKKDSYHCIDDCEWFDGEDCAVWRIVKALEGTIERLDGIQNALAEIDTELQQMHRR